jgi:hypothetical protein
LGITWPRSVRVRFSPAKPTASDSPCIAERRLRCLRRNRNRGMDETKSATIDS